MKILVLIKQVPEAVDLQFDPVTKTLIREGVKSGINAYDRRAISEAVSIRSKRASAGDQNTTVTAITMGPPQARDALLEALLMGVDETIHIQDRALAGSDTLITAKVLAAAARKIGFDLILCGQHTTDSETAQVPAELAELLGIGFAAAVRKIEYQEKLLRAFCEMDEGTATYELNLPCVLSTGERLIKPISTKGADLSAAPAAKIQNWDLHQLGFDPSEVGLNASPTWVADIYEDRMQRTPTVQENLDPALVARMILEVISAKAEEEMAPPVPPTNANAQPEFWVLVEWTHNGTRGVSYEMLSFAALLANWLDGSVSALCINGTPAVSEISQLSAFGADRIYVAQADEDQAVALLAQQIKEKKPYAFFVAATSSGKVLAPRIAAQLGLGLTGDCVGFEIDDQKRLVHIKPAFGGNVLAPIYSRTFPQFATVRPGALPTMAPRESTDTALIQWEPPKVSPSKKLLDVNVDHGSGALKLDNSEVVIGVGIGVQKENLPLIDRLSELLNAGVAATRRVVDSGWMERQFQVGLTGRFIAPRVYLALGISGRQNHAIAIRKAKSIVAVNSDPNADIFKFADFGFVNDSAAVLNELIRLLEK